MKKIKEIYEDLPLRFKICVLIVICLVLLVLNVLLSSDNTESINLYTKDINYKSTSASELLENYTETYQDRDTYIEIKDIIEDLRDVSDGTDSVYTQYYVAIDSNYSKYLSKKNYASKMNSIFSSIGNDYTIKLYTDEYHLDTYIVELIVEEETAGYIGIILDTTLFTYSIFYIE